MNHKLCSILGYSRPELLASRFRQIHHPDDDPLSLPSVASAPLESLELPFVKKDGVAGWLSFTAALSSPDVLIVFIQDITARKEQFLALRESEHKFRTLADRIPQLAWMADASGWIYWYNQRWYDYTGTTPEQMQGWGWKSVHDPDELPFVLQRWTTTLENGQPLEMVFPLRAADGTFRPFLTHVMPVHDHRGQVSGWFGTNTDFTNQKRTEDALRRSNHDLEQFAYAASHDLQEPVRTVATLTQLLERHTEYSLDELSREWMRHIVASSQRMGTLIADLLAYSRVTLDSASPTQLVDLNAVLADVLAQLHVQIQEHHAKIESDPLPTIRGIPLQLGQVFQNLISNALRFAKRGQIPEVKISAQRHNLNWILSVEDQGVGFDPAYTDRVFGIFKRLHGTDIPGNGIGLAICKTVISRHGGNIWVQTAENEGATFYFSLPATSTKAELVDGGGIASL